MLSQFFLGFVACVCWVMACAMYTSYNQDMVPSIGFLIGALMLHILGTVNMWIRDPAKIRKSLKEKK